MFALRCGLVLTGPLLDPYPHSLRLTPPVLTLMLWTWFPGNIPAGTHGCQRRRPAGGHVAAQYVVGQPEHGVTMAALARSHIHALSPALILSANALACAPLDSVWLCLLPSASAVMRCLFVCSDTSGNLRRLPSRGVGGRERRSKRRRRRQQHSDSSSQRRTRSGSSSRRRTTIGWRRR